MIYKKFYTVKEWQRFDKVVEHENGIDITAQEVLLKKYDVILTDYKTKLETMIELSKKISPTNLNKGLNYIDKGFKKFDNGIIELNNMVVSFSRGLKV